MATLRSPSSRRAWIEIDIPAGQAEKAAVALLAEGVDRNFRCFDPEKKSMASPSSRRAWIEIRHT